MIFRSLNVALLIVISGFVAGCGDTATGPSAPAAPPAVPPSATMNADFSFFGLGRSAGKSGAQGSGTEASSSHFFEAVDIAHYYHLAVASRFDPAIAVMDLALSVEPVEQGEGTYLWSFEASGFGHDIAIKLTSVQTGDTIDWELRVTDTLAQPALDDFLWIRGSENARAGSGHWIFADIDAAQAVDTDRIDYTSTAKSAHELRFQLLDTSDSEVGNTLTFRVDGDAYLVELFDVSDSETSDVTWNDADGSGSVRFVDYNDGERGCWDEIQENTDCGVGGGGSNDTGNDSGDDAGDDSGDDAGDDTPDSDAPDTPESPDTPDEGSNAG